MARKQGVGGAARVGRPLRGDALPLEPHAEACQQLRADLEEAFGVEASVRPLIARAVAAYRRELQAQREIEANGLLVPGLYGLVPNPAVGMEDRARRSVGYFISCLRQATRRARLGGPARTEQLPRKPTTSTRGTRYFKTA